MSIVNAKIALETDNKNYNFKANKLRFCLNRCLNYDDSHEEINIIKEIGGYLINNYPRLAITIDHYFFEYLINHFPEILRHVDYLVSTNPSKEGLVSHGITIVKPESLPIHVRFVFVTETLTVPLLQLKNILPKHVEALSLELIEKINWKMIPKQAWVNDVDSIYPIDIPDVDFYPNQDLILIDCPSRDGAWLPNGLAYVHNILKKCDIKFQTVDLDIILYHRFHTWRLLDCPENLVNAQGLEIPEDPWSAEMYELWSDAKPGEVDFVEYFQEYLQEVEDKLVKANPKILGLSIHSRNDRFSRELVQRVKSRLPDIIILVGGYNCYQKIVGHRAFPLSDYLVVGEAETVLPPLIKELVKGNKPVGLPGVASRYDTSLTPFVEGELVQDINSLEMPKYEWFGVELYRHYNYYQLVPIIASRGCRWSKCTFCAERFFWRIRTPKNLVDEIEWLAEQGGDLFMFNESDLNGQPDVVLKICDEIIRRGLKVRLTGQLRIHKRSDYNFFSKLHAAGFVSLRFGVDAWSKNTLRLQMKGYTKQMITDNLQACKESKISNEVNIVVGVPGETEEDIDESIELLISNKDNIDRVANINPLILMTGSVYWEDLDKYGICLQGDKEELLKKYPRYIPSSLWYSTEPYIDEQIRQQRFEKFVVTLYENDVPLGPFAEHVYRRVKEGKDVSRGSSAN